MNDNALVCPRCAGQMTTYSRSGVQVDQCGTCKGIFLDRGELEQLTQAEQAYYAPPPQPPAYPAQPYQQPVYPPPGVAYGGHHGGYDDSHHGGYRQRGFLHELFED